MEQIQVVNNNGKYECDINISTEEWLEILRDSDLTPSNTWNALMGFYNSPNYTANCKELDNDNPNAYKNPISSFGKRIQDKLKRFQVLTTKGEDGDYFIIPMKGFDKKNAFEWTLRPELVKAIEISLKFQEKLIPEAIEQYKQKLRDDPTYWEGEPNDKKKFGEKYKWEAIAHFQNNWNIDSSNIYKMFEKATLKTGNLLDIKDRFPRAMMLDFASIQPKQVEEMFRNLFDENIDLNQRFDNFKQKAKTLLEIYRSSHPEAQKANNHFQDTNTISTYLWFKYPDKYYKYAPGIYCSNRLKLGLYQYCIKDRDRTIDSMLQGFAMYDEIRAKLLKDKELVDLINSRVGDLHLEKDFEDDFRTATIDFGYFVSKHFQPTTQFSQEQVINMNNSEFNKKVSEIADVLGFKKNIILQGAPGTGKTYITAAVALKILGVDDQDFDFSDHPAVMGEYEKYRDKKRIFFTTFHQSMDYEDFVEGLKPELVKETEQNDYSNSTEKNVGVTYVCKRGIFKEACQAARVGQEFSKWLDDFLNSIIGFENKKEIPTVTGKSKIYVWWNIGNKTISVRPVSSTFEPVDRFVAAPNIEKIKLQATDEEEGKEPNYTSYAQAIIKYVCSEYGANTQNDGKNNVVLIIDEINRGNVSKIFGELVTLLEKDKREYDAHPISVTLPYSKEVFSVPSNVYIIGTMNTTDRSTGTLDYAIRRRFAFVTLEAKSDYIPEGKARDLFKDIRSFIENNHSSETDINDLMVGHSYFMPDNEVQLSSDEQLKLRIEYEVAPLLREYCNDELLTCSQKELEKHIDSWKELKVYNSSETQVPATSEQECDDEDSEE